MKRSILILIIIFLAMAQSVMAGKYFWVGNGGHWTDVSAHWATTSGGSTMHSMVPGQNDTVYFDANSFSQSGQTVLLDTLIGKCAMMDWSGIDHSVYLFSGINDTLRVYGSCLLSDSLHFNFTGTLEISALSPVIARLNFANNNLQCNVVLSSDSAILLSKLYLPNNRLSIVDGSFNTNGYNVTCKHFNTDSTLMSSIAVANPVWYGNDTLIIRGSMALSGLFNFQQNGPVYFNFNSIDKNYINAYTNSFAGNVFFNGSKKIYLCSPLIVAGNMNFMGGGHFYSKGYPVRAARLISNTSIGRTLSFSNSTINIDSAGYALNLQSAGLNLIADTSILFFNYTGSDTVKIVTGKDVVSRFKAVHLPSSHTLLYNSFKTSWLALGVESNVALARGITVTIDSLDTPGDCGHFSYLRAFCQTCPECGDGSACDTLRPILQTTQAEIVHHLKIRNIKAIGSVLVANNSFDEGNNSGWIINQPLTADTLYWVNGSGNWNDPSHWSTTSGVFTPGSCLPDKETSVIFDPASFSSTATIHVDENAYCHDMTWTNPTYNGTISGNGSLIVTGNLVLNPRAHFLPAGGFTLQSTVNGPYNIMGGGADIQCDLKINGTQVWKLTDSIKVAGQINLISGELNLNQHNLRCHAFLTSGTNNRILNYSNSAVFLYGSDTTWRSTGSNLSLIGDTSSINLVGSSGDFMMIDAGNQNFDTLNIRCPKAKIANGINCHLLSVREGTLLECEPNKVVRFDSVIAFGLCDKKITLSAYASSTDTVIFSSNQVKDSIVLSNVIIRNICADTIGQKKYMANASTGLGKYSGWNITGSALAQKYYWSGIISTSWHDPRNWEVNDTTADCLPGPMDTVIFDKAHLSIAPNDTIKITENAYCGAMLWKDSISGKPALLLGSDLICTGSVQLCDSLSVRYTSDYKASDENAPRLSFLLQNSNGTFNPDCREFGVNINLQGKIITDTLLLTDHLLTDQQNSLTICSGSFLSNQKDIQTGIISTTGNQKKNVNFYNSNVNVTYSFTMQPKTLLKLNMDSSSLVMDDNFLFYNIFDGGNQHYNQVEFHSRETGYSQVHYRADIESSDTIKLLIIKPGIHLKLKSGITQAFDSIVLQGECTDSIYIQTSEKNISATLRDIGNDSIKGNCLNVGDIIASPIASAIYSTNMGGNSNWNFSTKKLSTAAFQMNEPTCFNDSIRFQNTTHVLSEDINDLSFIWAFGDNDSSSLFEPVHMYSDTGKYYVSLISIDTASECRDIFNDTITIYRPNVRLSTFVTDSINDYSICQGDTVTFRASSTNPDPFYQFVVSGDSLTASADSMLITTSLNNGDEIFVIVEYNECLDTSNHFTYRVDSLPNVLLTSNEPDTAICVADTIVLKGNGADFYQLYRNDSVYGSFGINNQWMIPGSSDNGQFTLLGKNILTGCKNKSNDTLTLTVHPLPVMTLTSSDPDLTICSGDSVLFSTSGALYYQYFQNENLLGDTTFSPILILSNLNNGDMVHVTGTSAEGCTANSGVLEFTVNPTPTVLLTSQDPDGIICSGESITFNASGADTYQFYVNGDSTGNGSSNSLTTSTLHNGDLITARGLLGSCPAMADTTIIIDVRPTITWTNTPASICADDTIHFTAHGDVQYLFSIDGLAQGSPGADSIFHATGLSNGQIITVSGSSGACTPSGVTAIIHPLPLPVFTCSDPDTIICQGNPVTFTASGADQYAYFLNGNQLSSFSGINVYNTDSLSNGDAVTLQARTSFGCDNTSADAYTFTVHPYPVINFACSDADQTICAGDTLQFIASGADVYEFFVTGASQGSPATDSIFSSANLNMGAIISVAGTTGYCSLVSPTTFTVTVNPLPILGFTPISPVNYCTGDTLQLLATGATGYEFFVDGISAGPASGNNIFTSTSLTDGQTVSLTGTLSGCIADADTTYTVGVNDYPLLGFINNLSSSSLCYGDTVIFQGNGAEDYVFYLDGIPVSHDSSFTITGLEQGQTVSLRGGNGVCWIDADTSFSPNINYVNLQINSSPSGTMICAGDVLTVNATGADVYQFYVDGIPAGSANTSGIFSTSTLTDGQIVSIEGSLSLSGCTQLSAENLLIHVLPAPTLPTVPPGWSICEGDSTLLTASVHGNLTWYHDATVMPDAEGQSIYIDQPGTYQVALVAGADSACLSVGSNFYGQLGDHTQINSLDFSEAENLNNLVDVACGDDFTLALTSNGEVKAWGRNEFGALGTGNFTNAPAPVNAGSISTATKIAAGMRHSLALLQDSTIVAWGDNTFGQLGMGNNFTSNFPFPVTGLTHIVDIAAGDNFCLALTSDGHVWAWGQNQYGQLGDSTVSNRNLPVQVTGLNQIAAIRAGGNHSVALKNDGSLWIWGANNGGQLGTGDYTGSLQPIKVNLPLGIISFDAGFAHTIAADSAGHVYCWGDNTFGQIGNGSTLSALYPVKITEAGKALMVRAGKYNSYAIRTDNNVFSWGMNTNGALGQQHSNGVTTPAAVPALFGITAMDAGVEHFAALSSQEHSCTSNNVTLDIDTVPDVIVYLQGTTLYTLTQGAAYQWYYDGNSIPGATDSTLQISAQGIYWVVINFDNGCSAVSSDYNFQLGFDMQDTDQLFSLYPNPNNGVFTLQRSVQTSSSERVEIRIMNVVGQTIYQENHPAHKYPVVIDLSGTPTGVYFVEIRMENGQKIRKPMVIQ